MFQSIDTKESLWFIKFDIVSFYPSITSELLTRALNFAKSLIFISQEDQDIINQARKSFLYLNNQPWTKKGQEEFDVPMGSFDGAELCE